MEIFIIEYVMIFDFIFIFHNFFLMPGYNENLHNKANPSTYDNAHYLRQVKTEAEDKLWQSIRNRKVMNLKFRR